MKALRMPFAAAVALLLCAAPANAINLEMNGGFETGDFSGWQQFPNGGSQAITTINPASGTYAANLTQTGPNNSLIKNANIGIGVVTPGQLITISFAARGTTANGGVIFAEFFSEVDGGGVSSAEILGGGPLALNADPNVWTTYTFMATAGPDVSGGVTLQLGAVCGAAGGCLADVWFDDVSVTVVPVPAAVWMFASALGALGWLKRRVA